MLPSRYARRWRAGLALAARWRRPLLRKRDRHHGTSAGAFGYFVGVPPGAYRLRLTPVDPSKTLSCTMDTTHGPRSSGIAGEPNAFHVIALAAQPVGLWAFCSLQ